MSGRSSTLSSAASRLAFIDALKAIASQLIVVHHLAFYGPMSDYALPLAPKFIPWLYDYARIAVQAFLVMGGFLAAQALARDGQLTDKPVFSLLWRRYLKLVPPYLGALLLAIASAAIASHLIVHESIPEPPTLARFVAHLFLLQGILGFDGLSAGVWYVAIDFQLYTLLLATLWLTRRTLPQAPLAGRVLVVALLLASLFYFNRDDTWDNWAIYFFGAYGMGAITYWMIRRNHASVWLAVILALALASLVIDYRTRIAVALIVAVVLGLARYAGFIETWPKSGTVAWLGRISYSTFLVHYPICLLINALFERFVPHTPTIQFAGMILAWAASIAGGAIFYRQVECRAQTLLARRPSPVQAAL
jgi:peptidoglycan/LPS O-acetylase OafA/YrhL